MVKALILVALVADIFSIVSSTDQKYQSESSATSYAAASAASDSFNGDGNDQKSEAKAWAVSTSSSSTDLKPQYNTRCNGPNEIYACGGACDNVCETLHIQNQTNCPIVNIRCNDKCYCKKGYARDKNNICIPIYKCPKPKCGKHQVYSDCIQRQCTPRTCAEVGYPSYCPKIETCDCKQGCICEKGYVRNFYGECVPLSHCPPKCGKHEVSSDCIQRQCSPRTCAEVGYPSFCPKIETCDCKKGCICEKGFVRNAKGECVPINHCPPKCGKHEVSSDCIQRQCSPRTCAEVGYPSFCPKIETCDCKKGCICEKGFVRNAKGECVPINHCPPKCGINEFFSSCVQSTCNPQYCTQLGFPIACRKIDPKYCKIGCLCKKGYVRNQRGICVPTHKCPPKCGKYEVYSDCIQRQCGPRTCSQVGFPISCQKIDPAYCKTGCICEKGFVRNAKGECIPVNRCPPKCGKYEVYSDCIQRQCGPRTCSQVGFPIFCQKMDPAYCKKGCICEEGFVRNSNGVCIPVNECPSCGGDDHAKPGCGMYCNQHCSDIGKEPKSCIALCHKNSCDCKNGFFYDSNQKKCVRSKDCTPTCGIYEVFSNCVQSTCNPQYCTQLGFPIACRKIDPKFCRKGCLCKKGYLRNKKGICVPAKECPPVCGKNELFEDCTKPNCRPHKCSELGFPLKCSNATHACKKRCVCKPGYVRNDKGHCIPIKECPPTCGPNEFHDICANGGCRQKYCSQLGGPTLCNDPIKCKEGCSCKKGFFRLDATGECVPERDCPKKCKGPNEYFFCGPPCDNVCSELHKQSKDKCPIKNKKCVPRCYCKDGYARNRNGTCIEICDCPDG